MAKTGWVGKRIKIEKYKLGIKQMTGINKHSFTWIFMAFAICKGLNMEAQRRINGTFWVIILCYAVSTGW